MGYCLDLLSLFYYYLKANVLIVDYRGHGSSTGLPNEKGLEVDSEAVIKYALSCPVIDHSKIFLFGKALGGAVAISCMQKNQNNIQGLIVENSFISIDAVIDEKYPWISCMKSMLLRSHWKNMDKIGTIEKPIMIVKGERDEYLKGNHSEKLYEVAKKSMYKEIYVVKDGDHSECYKPNPKEYIDHISEFIKKALIFSNHPITK